MTTTRPARLLATDIDGTMLRADSTLSPRVREALHAAVAAGIHVVPTTGRPALICRDVHDWTGLDGFWIYANGAVTRHRGRDETVRMWLFDAEVARTLVADVRAVLPQAGFALEMETDVAWERGFEHTVPNPPPNDPVDDVLDALDLPVQKVLVFARGVPIDTLHRLVADAVGDDGVVSYSGLAFVEVAARLVTKATAVAALADDLGLTRDEVVTVGDNHNDLPMLEWASRSYAMGNATADALETAASILPTSDEDGLAVLIDALIAERSDPPRG